MALWAARNARGHSVPSPRAVNEPLRATRPVEMLKSAFMTAAAFGVSHTFHCNLGWQYAEHNTTCPGGRGIRLIILIIVLFTDFCRKTCIDHDRSAAALQRAEEWGSGSSRG